MYKILLCLPLLSFIFVQCTNSSAPSEPELRMPQIQEVSAESVFTEADETSVTEKSVQPETVLTKTCQKLKAEYADLIQRLNENQNDKALIAELGEWTKDSNHLYCTETYRIYNDFVEELNESL